jgi:hypothetical protein
MLNKHNLNLAKLAPTNERRLAAGIRVTPSITAVTDGSLLATVTTADMKPADTPEIPGFSGASLEFTPFTLDKDTALKVAKALPRRCHIPILNFAFVGKSEDNGHAELAVTDLDSPQVFRPKKVDHPSSYPDWEKVIPLPEHSTGKMVVNADALIALLQQAKDMAHTRSHAVKIELYCRPVPPRKNLNGTDVPQPDVKMVRIDVDSMSEPTQHFMGLLCEMTE